MFSICNDVCSQVYMFDYQVTLLAYCYVKQECVPPQLYYLATHFEFTFTTIINLANKNSLNDILVSREYDIDNAILHAIIYEIESFVTPLLMLWGQLNSRL